MQQLKDVISLPSSRVILVACDIPSLAYKVFKNSMPKKLFVQYTPLTGMYKKDESLSVSTPHQAVDTFLRKNTDDIMLLEYSANSLDESFESSVSNFSNHLTKQKSKLLIFCKPTVAHALEHCGKLIDVNNSEHYLYHVLKDKYSLLDKDLLIKLNNTPVKSFLKAFYKTIGSVDFISELFNNLGSSSNNDYLEYIPPNPHMYGLPKLSEWVLRRKPLVNGKHPVPLKGISLIGIPGVGKTRSAGLISHLLELPAYKFNILSCLDRYVGQSEGNVESALRAITKLGKCVILLDEVDKIFGSNDDNGTSSRILSILLSFMDNNTECFWVVTGNVVERIPPELLRKGRLNEYFHIGLPTFSGVHDYISYICKVYSDYGFVYDEEYIKEMTNFCLDNKLLFNDIVSLMEDVYIDFITGNDNPPEVISSYYRHEDSFNKILEWSKDNAKSAI